MKFLLYPLGILAVFSIFCVAQADDDRQTAIELLKSGQIVSVEVLLKKVQSEFPGHILKIKLDDEDDAPSGWVYETKLLREDGVVMEIEYDAKSLEIVKVEKGKQKKDHRK
ncbi:hypothetical protein GCM10011332_24060 [Terasakiella brassicae]|uniref:PepSY domain-containing protein n=1 Tax=Terasakiella brassicae TaxID=1634917 RepID=A0A917FEW8_9PROT|nr:PepSY domain-containing protein [Terasakiella brassicae]GGF69071.1 hypothetical protein GCM10011332_24060 [Terasakiella brassicae]